MLMSGTDSINNENKEENKSVNDMIRNDEASIFQPQPTQKTTSKCFKFLINFKEIFLLIILYGANIRNFSILNLPYTLCAIILSFSLLNHSPSASRLKYILVIVTLVYSCLVLIFKLVVYILYNLDVKDFKELVEEYKILLINFGMRYLEKEDSISRNWDTFLCDSIVIFALIFFLVIKCLGKGKYENAEVFDMMKVNNSNYTRVSNTFLSLISISVLGITCTNMSFTMLFYAFLIHLGFFLWIFNKNHTYHRLLYYFLSFILTSYILVSHIFNIYSLRKAYLGSTTITREMKWLGITKLHFTVEGYFNFFLHVIANCLCIIAIKINNYFTTNIKNSFAESDSIKSDQNHHDKNFWLKAKELMVKYIFSPYFVMHFCRISSVYWVWRYINFPTVGLLIWLFYSFCILNAASVKWVTYILGWPSLVISYYVFMVANIPEVMDDYITDENREQFKLYGLEKFEIPPWEFLFVQFTITMFTVLMRVNTTNKSLKVEKLGSGSSELREKFIEDEEMPLSQKYKKTEVSLFDLLVKLFFTNIDKISLIVMYFAATKEVNISHLILTTVFLIQLIFPKWVKKICFYIIILISIIFVFEYIIDILKIYLSISDETIIFLNIFIKFGIKEKSAEILLPFIAYCFYIQYQNYNSEIYKSYDSDEITFDCYINSLLKNYKNFKSFILLIVSFVQEIYIWIIFVLFFCCIVAFEKYFLFSIKLVIFFKVMYNFLTMEKEYKICQKIVKYIWIMIIFCGVNTLLIYFYQFTALDYFSSWYKDVSANLPKWLQLNLAIFGFEQYKLEDMAIELIPHYGSNLLSVLILWEVNRILGNIKLSEEKLSTDSNKFSDSDRELGKQLDSKSVKTNSEQSLRKVNYFLLYTLQVVLFLCKTYWLIIFLSICAFITAYQISFSMIIYILIFTVSYFFMFNSLVRKVHSFLTKNNKFFISRLIRFSIIEKEKNLKVIRRNREITFKFLLAFSMFYIFLTYIYAIFDDIQNENPIVSAEVENYFKSYAYIFGIFHDSVKASKFIISIWGHLFMIVLISLDIYVQRLQKWTQSKVSQIQSDVKQNYILTHTKRKDTKKKQKKSTGSNPIQDPKIGSFKSAMSFNNEVQIEKIPDRSESIHSINSVKIKTEHRSSFDQRIKALSFKIEDFPFLNKFMNVFKNYEENLKNQENIDYYSKLDSKTISFSLEMTIKKLLEELITFLILLSAILKLNVFSLFYIILVFYLQIKGKNLKRMFNVSNIVSFLIILQSCFYLSNLSIHTDPQPNRKLLELLKDTLNVPWYPAYMNDSWGYFFNMGVNSYQIQTLWGDFVVIIISFIYMDNFTYSIYEHSPSKKVNLYSLKNSNTIKKSVSNLTLEEYNEIKQSLKVNFEIELVDFDRLKQEIISSENDESNLLSHSSDLNVNITKKKRNKCHTLFSGLKSTLFLTLHNLILVVILILSMMSTGLISTFYTVFSLYYLYSSNNIVLAKYYSLPKALDKFLRIFFLVDLFLQMAYQNPLNLYLKDYEYILKSIGLNKAIEFNEDPNLNTWDLKTSILTSLKAVMYFFVCIQVMIYSSSEFTDFYVGFILKKKETIFRSSLINAFLFNNKRIKNMQYTMEKRKKIDEVLNQLEIQLEKWNKKLSNEEDGKQRPDLEVEDISQKENKPNTSDNIDDQTKSENEIRSHIKEKIYSGLLIKFAIMIYRKTTNYSTIEKENKKELENAIIRGETFIHSLIEKKIDSFVEELDIKEIQLKELDTILENEEEAVEKIYAENEVENEETRKEKIRKSYIKNLPIEEKVRSPLDKIDLNKYNSILHDNLFVKYLTKTYMLSFIVWNICKFLMDNFQYICFFFMFLNNFQYASLISMFYPFAIFIFGMIEYPRPSYKFWKTCRMYASIILVLKCIIQFDFIKNINVLNSIFKLLEKYKIGFIIYDSTYSGEFVYYIIFDAVMIFILMMQEYILIARGLWDYTELEIETVEDANNRIHKALAVHDIDAYKEEILNQRKVSLKENIRPTFSERAFPTIRNYKPGSDFYSFYTIIEMVLVVYIIFFYTDMDQDNMFKLQGTSKIRQFSGTMVIIAFFHAIKAVIDRIIYVQQNRSQLEFDYVYYSKETGDKLSKEKLEEMQISSPKDLENYPGIDYIYFQKETRNYPLIFKYILQVVITIFSHFFIFFFLPMTGNKNLQNSINCEVPSLCNDFNSNFYIQLFYIIYSLYLLFSALQIYYGLLDMRNKSLVMRGDNIIYSSCFKAYKAIPFLYELKLTIDWTFTPTCLDLFKWLKFESVYDLLFGTHCTKKSEMNTPIGKNISAFSKALMGGSSFVILLAILLGPLLIFSTLNPSNVVNNVTGANIELTICFQQGPVFNNFTLFKNDFVDSIESMNTDKNYEIWKTYGYLNSSQTKNFPTSQVQIIRMSETSDTIWDIAGPHITTIKDRLENYRNYTFNIYLGFKYNFERPSPPEAKDSVKKFDYPLYIPNVVDHSDYIKILIDNIKFCNKTDLVIDNFYNPALRLTSQSHPKVIWDNANFLNMTISTNFICDYNEGNIDYTKSYHMLSKKDPRDPTPNLVFHTFSDKVSNTSTAYDVVTFYISFIIVIGRVIRGVISGEAEKIVFTEMPEPNSLINLCEGIKISRYRFEFEREEHLYNVLIDFMRSPEILKMLTKSSLKKLQERKEKLSAIK